MQSGIVFTIHICSALASARSSLAAAARIAQFGPGCSFRRLRGCANFVQKIYAMFEPVGYQTIYSTLVDVLIESESSLP